MEPEVWQKIQDALTALFEKIEEFQAEHPGWVLSGIKDSIRDVCQMAFSAQDEAKKNESGLLHACYDQFGNNSHLCAECTGCDNEKRYTCALNRAEWYRNCKDQYWAEEVQR